MDIVEFQKRWIMRYINPVFFYLPFQSCEVKPVSFNIKVVLWNTYNPVDKTYKDRLTEKGRLINRPCDYYKILITYLGDMAKDDKDRREELVYCSRSLNNGGQKESYDEGILCINQMADGTPLKPGRYRAHIFATFGIGAPAKQGDKNYYQEFDFYPAKDNGKTYLVHVNWHLVALKTYTGNPTHIWTYNMKNHNLGKTPDSYMVGVNWTTVHESPLDDPVTGEPVIKDTYLKSLKCQLSNCQTHQILKDTFSNEELSKVPFQEEPISYWKKFGYFLYTESGFGTSSRWIYTPQFSIASSRCCFEVSQSYAWALFGSITGILPWQSGYGWRGCKGTLKVELKEVKGGFSLKDPITSEDYTQELADGKKISMPYQYWNNFLPGLDPDGNPLDPNRLDGSDYKNVELSSGRLPSVYLSFEVERSQEELCGGILGGQSFESHPELNVSYSGYRKTDFMGQKAVIPIGGDYQSFKNGIMACRDGSPPQSAKFVNAYEEICFGTPDDYAIDIEYFDTYNMNLFYLDSKNGYYTRAELADYLIDVENFKPWFDELLELGEDDNNPKYQFTFEGSDWGKYELRRQKSETSPENPILFYLYDEQAWKNCTGYALCDFLPAELPYPDLSIYQPVQKETVSEN